VSQVVELQVEQHAVPLVASLALLASAAVQPVAQWVEQLVLH
jgi:hypothetical protein